MNATRAVTGRCPWPITVQIHGWRQRKLVSFDLFNIARGFENVCEIISDQSKWKPRKKLIKSYLQRRKMENQRQKELLTTWECPKKETFTTVDIVCHCYERLAVLQNVFGIIMLWARKDVEKLFEETVYKYDKENRRHTDEKWRLELKKCLN